MERFQTHKKILIGFLNMTIVASMGAMLLMYSPANDADGGKPAQLFTGGLSLLDGPRDNSNAPTRNESTPEPEPTPAAEVAAAPTAAPQVSAGGGGGVGPAVADRPPARVATANMVRSPGNAQSTPATSNRVQGLSNLQTNSLLRAPQQNTQNLLKKVDKLIGR